MVQASGEQPSAALIPHIKPIVRNRIDQFFKALNERLGRRVDVEWRSNEAMGTIELDESFYVYVVVSWSDSETYIEYLVGDENAVIRPEYVDKLEEAVKLIKAIHGIARGFGIPS